MILPRLVLKNIQASIGKNNNIRPEKKTFLVNEKPITANANMIMAIKNEPLKYLPRIRAIIKKNKLTAPIINEIMPASILFQDDGFHNESNNKIIPNNVISICFCLLFS